MSNLRACYWLCSGAGEKEALSHHCFFAYTSLCLGNWRRGCYVCSDEVHGDPAGMGSGAQAWNSSFIVVQVPQSEPRLIIKGISQVATFTLN